MKKTVILNVLTILFTALSWSSCTKDVIDLTGDIYGKVTDAVSGEPISGVNIIITPGGRSTVAGSDGTFTFTDCDAGQYSLQAQKNGYKTNYKQISVRAGETAMADMTLMRAETADN